MAIYQPTYYGQQYNPFQPQFQQPMQIPQLQQPQIQQQQAAQRNWVQGIAGAKSFLVAPGQTVDLWDSEDTIIYLKSADANGIPSMKILDYTIRSETGRNITPKSSDEDVIHRNEFKSLMDRVEKLEGGVNNGEPAI